MNQLSIVNIFCPFASTYRKLSAIFKKPAGSTPVSFDWRDWRRPARLPRSNEATGQVTKGQAAQPAYASLANEVVPLFFAGQPLVTDFISLRGEDRGGILSLNWVRRTSVILKIERSIYPLAVTFYIIA